MNTQPNQPSVENCFVSSNETFLSTSWNEAIRWARKFRETFGEKQVIDGEKVRGYGLTVENFETLIKQDGQNLKGIKIYLGIDDQECFRVVIVAVEDSNGNDYKVPPPGTNTDEVENGTLPLLGQARPCPEWCGRGNVLNSD